MLVGTNHRKILYHLMKTITISLFGKADLLYTVQLCLMRYAYHKSTTRVVSCKSSLQLACDCCVRHVVGFLKHVLKLYDNRSYRQFYIVEIVQDFSMT